MLLRLSTISQNELPGVPHAGVSLKHDLA